MKPKKHNVLLSTCAIALVLISASCKKDNNSGGIDPYGNQPPGGQNPTATVTSVQLTSNAKFGNILTDNNGRTLYFFSDDANGSSTCTDGCLVAWPAFYQANLTYGTGINSSDFATITRNDGSKQTTYKGWPLYYYQGDTKAGDVNGDGVGKNWFVAKADYTVMVSYNQLVGQDGQMYNSAGKAGQEQSQYITDPDGNTLYAFVRDKSKQNNYSTGDATHDAIWPVYAISGNIGSIPSILDKTQFDVITVFGQTQLVYKGHPLYYYGPDSKQRGKTLGISVPTPGADIWPIVNLNTVAN